MRPALHAPAAVLAAALVWLAAPRPAAGDLLLNEVLYDPEGPDEGAEFVELWNPDPAPRPLAGVAIEAADGARPDVWAAVWMGSAADSAPPGAAFLVRGDMLVSPLQNGPDAIRLTRGGAVLDLLGYGALDVPSLCEGSPAADAGSGESLARLRDGADSGDNSADWAAETAPTPGRANHPEVAAAFLAGGLALEPEVPWPGEGVAAIARVRNLGLRALGAGEWAVELERLPWPGSGDPAAPLASRAGGALAPGESARVAVVFTAPAERGPVRLRARIAGRSPAAAGIADTTLAALRCGAGPAVVSEFAFRGPAGEWVEIEAVEPVPDLGALALADRTGRSFAVDRGAAARPASPGARVVLAESPAELRTRAALPESVVLGLHGGWPSLNDSDGDDGVADVVRLLEAGTGPCDAVPYSRAFSDRGGSVERLAPDLPSAARATWVESIDPSGGTPGRANSLGAARGGPARRGSLLAVSSRVVRRLAGGGIEPARLRITEEARGRRLRVEVRDLLGRARRLLVDGQRFPGEAALLWDGRDDGGNAVPPGIYALRAEAQAEAGSPARATTVALSVAPERGR